MKNRSGKINLLGLTYDDLVETLKLRYGKGKYHAADLYRAFYRDGLKQNESLRQIKAFANSPDLADSISRDLALAFSPVMDRQSQDGVIKYVTRLSDSLEIESVIIPMERHKTLCISSQVGCRRMCRICETGKQGFQRNLTAEEIVGQVYRAVLLWQIDIKSIVYMGMGEPLDNLENVIQSIRIISDQRGLNIARRHISVSTVGIPSGLKRLGALGWPDLNIAISLNAPNNRIRSSIMPVNRSYPMATLKKSLLEYPLKKKGNLFMAYVLIKGLNDSYAHAMELADFLKPLQVKVNVIPYSPLPGSPFMRPTDETITRFCDCLAGEGMFVRERKSKGMNLMAACGQLGNRRRPLSPGYLF